MADKRAKQPTADRKDKPKLTHEQFMETLKPEAVETPGFAGPVRRNPRLVFIEPRGEGFIVTGQPAKIKG
jgi:hypothetical protein